MPDTSTATDGAAKASSLDASVATTQVASAPTRAGAGAPYDGTWNGDVIVATITDVCEKNSTNGRPPHLVLDVHEVLRGDPRHVRTHAVWQPLPHDIDYGDPEKNPAFHAWKARPLAGPKVGRKLILWGELRADRDAHDFGSVFDVNPFHRYDATDDRRAWAIKEIQTAEAELKKWKEEKAEAQRRHQAAMVKWRQSLSDVDLRNLAAEADIVVIGKVCSGPTLSIVPQWRYLFQVSEVLKPKASRDHKFVSATVEKSLGELLYTRERSWILFLSSRDSQPSHTGDIYRPLRMGTAAVEADDAAVNVVRNALRP
jgi:hypothetical protein